MGRRGHGGDSGGRGQGHRLRRARHWRWTAGGRQREGNGGGQPEGGREKATAVDSRREAEREGNGGGQLEGGSERATAEVRGKKSGKKRCNSGKTVNFVLSFANNKGFD